MYAAEYECVKSSRSPLRVTLSPKEHNHERRKLTVPEALCIKGPYQCYYISLFFVNNSHIGYPNPAHFCQDNIIYEICVTLVKKNICVKIRLCANIRARKAALVRNYFPGVITLVSKAPGTCLSRLAIFDQINADVLFRRVNYLYQATFTCPEVFPYPVSTWVAVNGV